MTDGELIDRFLNRSGEAAELAFAALVERHGAMVLQVCRSILRNDHDSEDAFQATFLVLVRRAGSVRNRDSLASWLHGTALRVAACSRADAARRTARERTAAGLRTSIDDSKMPDLELSNALHGELARLPERYRAAVCSATSKAGPARKRPTNSAGRSGPSRVDFRGVADDFTPV